jgi:integrase
MRLHRAEKGKQLFEAFQIRGMVDGALVVGKDGPELVQPGPSLRTMVLLAINCGFGNSDCGTLPRTALDLDAGWIDFARAKTGIPRRCPLWPETIAAIKDTLAKRHEPKEEADAGLFITKYGYGWSKDTSTNPVSQETKKLLNNLGIKSRKGIGFYTLRHTFRTVADEAKDQPACDYLMGHESPHMSSVYRERINDARLRAVTDYVHAWLFLPAVAAEVASDGKSNTKHL